MDREPQDTLYQPEQFPLYYQGSGQFKVGANPSGVAGAIAQVAIEINNYPHIAYGFRVVNTYSLPSAFVVANPFFRMGLLLGGTDDDQTIEINFAQQNITARAINQRAFQGLAGINWHPFAVPYFLRGGNNMKLTFTRVTTYPTVNDGEEPPVDVEIFPTVDVTLVTGVLVSDYFPAAGAPSTEALPGDERLRRG